MNYYNNQRSHSGKYCFGKTPMETCNESITLARHKMLDHLPPGSLDISGIYNINKSPRTNSPYSAAF